MNLLVSLLQTVSSLASKHQKGSIEYQRSNQSDMEIKSVRPRVDSLKKTNKPIKFINL